MNIYTRIDINMFINFEGRKSMYNDVKFSVFTKPWKDISLEELAFLVKDMGFDAIEYPLRAGYQVQPEDGAAGIKKLCSVMNSNGLEISSIAGGIDVRFVEGSNEVIGIDEELFAGCGEAGVKIIRICQNMERGLDFHQNLDQIRYKYDALLPYCEKYNVTLGVQMHFGYSISNSAETYLLLKDYDPRYIAAVWDSGHSGLAGNEPSFAIDTVWEQLCMVNFKAAYRWRINGPEQFPAKWDVHWTTGKNACGEWKEAVDHLKKRGYKGYICLPAEYSDEANVEAYTREDIAYIKQLFAD